MCELSDRPSWAALMKIGAEDDIEAIYDVMTPMNNDSIF